MEVCGTEEVSDAATARKKQRSNREKRIVPLPCGLGFFDIDVVCDIPP